MTHAVCHFPLHVLTSPTECRRDAKRNKARRCIMRSIILHLLRAVFFFFFIFSFRRRRCLDETKSNEARLCGIPSLTASMLCVSCTNAHITLFFFVLPQNNLGSKQSKYNAPRKREGLGGPSDPPGRIQSYLAEYEPLPPPHASAAASASAAH